MTISTSDKHSDTTKWQWYPVSLPVMPWCQQLELIIRCRIIASDQVLLVNSDYLSVLQNLWYLKCHIIVILKLINRNVNEWQVYEYVNMRSACKMEWADNNLSINPLKYQDTFKIGPNLRPCLLMSNANLLQISHVWTKSNISISQFRLLCKGKGSKYPSFHCSRKGNNWETGSTICHVLLSSPLLDVIYSFVWLHHSQVVAQKCHWTVTRQKRVAFSLVLISDITMLLHDGQYPGPLSDAFSAFPLVAADPWLVVIMAPHVPCNPCIF